MSYFFFMLLLILASLIRIPLAVVFILLKNIVPKIKMRIDFERKNFLEESARSFSRDNLRADYCFEVSSEGELEQVRPLLEHYLREKKLIELLYASPSVESKCLKLAASFPEHLRVIRVPLMSFFPVSFLYFQSLWTWVTAPKIVFCRYDFFPELLLFKLFGKKFILLSAAGKKPTWFKMKVFSLFDLIVAASSTEEHFFKKHFPHKKIFTFDFRIPRIFERLDKSSQVLAATPELQSYLAFIKLKKRTGEALVLGSAWDSDLQIFEADKAQWASEIQNGRQHLLVVPHSLKADSILQITTHLRELFSLPVYEIKKGQDFNVSEFEKNPGVVLLNLSGILCELYSQFECSYVGGGYERSIHSVLEPFLAGNRVFCGPLVHRSVEYDFLQSVCPGEIHLLKNPESFYNDLKKAITLSPDKTLRMKLKTDAVALMSDIIREIGQC